MAKQYMGVGMFSRKIYSYGTFAETRRMLMEKFPSFTYVTAANEHKAFKKEKTNVPVFDEPIRIEQV